MTRQHNIANGLNAVSEFCKVFQSVFDGLLIVKREHKQFKQMKSRKFLLLCYLHSLELQRGYFTQIDICRFYRQGRKEYAIKYWSLLISEGWLHEIEFKKKYVRNVKKAKPAKVCGCVSPLFASLLRLVWGARLRRTVGYAKGKGKGKGKRQRLPTGEVPITSVPGCKVPESKPAKTAFETLFEDVKDERK